MSEQAKVNSFVVYALARGRGVSGFKARNAGGASCLHIHRSAVAAQRCADRLNRPAPAVGSDYNAGYQYAAGYQD